MAGGGGSTGYTAVDAEQNSMHQMLARGVYGAIATAKGWDGAAQTDAAIPYAADNDYVDAPSLLRFIHDKGTTDAGGNPFEGVSAYEPDEDLDTAESVTSTFQTLIEDLAHDGDWEDDVASAVAQKAAAVPTLDYDAVFSGLITSAISRAATAVSDSFTNAEADIQALVDETTARSLASSQTAVSTIIAGAAADIAVNVPTLITSAKDSADEAMTEAAADAEDRSEDLLSSIQTTVLAADADAESASDNIMTDSEADVVTAMVSQATAMATLHTAVAAEVKTRTDTDVGGAKMQGDTVADAEGAKGITFAAGLADGVLPDAVSTGISDMTSVGATSRANAKSAMLEIVGAVNPAISPVVMEAVANAKSVAVTVMTDAVTAAVDSVQGAPIANAVNGFRKRALKPHLRAVNRFAGGMADINAVNSSAFVIGMALLESDFTDNVTDYQAKLELETFSQILPQFLNTFQQTVSAYMDSYEKRFAETLDIYKTELPMQTQIFLSVMPEYMRTYMMGFAEYMKAYQAVMAEYTNISKDKDQAAINIVNMQAGLQTAFADVRNRLAQALVAVQAGAFSQALNAHSGMLENLTAVNEKVFSDLTSARMNGYLQLIDKELQTVEDSFVQHLGAFSTLVQTQIGQAMSTELTEKSHKQVFMNEGVRSLAAARVKELEGTRNLALLLDGNAKGRIIAKNEEYDRNLEYDALAANWDIELFQQAGNIIGAVTGTVVPRAGKPSKTQSVLGGAMGGASAGAALGPIGMGVGALAGGILGAQ